MWLTLLPLIVSEGLPFAEKMWKLISDGKEPTQADFDELRKFQKSPELQMSEALIRNGVDPNSERGQALLALVKDDAPAES